MPMEIYPTSDNRVSGVPNAKDVENGRQFTGQKRNLKKVQKDEEKNTLSKEEAKRNGIGTIIDCNT